MNAQSNESIASTADRRLPLSTTSHIACEEHAQRAVVDGIAGELAQGTQSLAIPIGQGRSNALGFGIGAELSPVDGMALLQRLREMIDDSAFHQIACLGDLLRGLAGGEALHGIEHGAWEAGGL